jgi:hypothetical protein
MAHPERRLLYSPGPDHLVSSCWSWSLQHAFCRDDIVLRLLGELWNFPPAIVHFLISIVVILVWFPAEQVGTRSGHIKRHSFSMSQDKVVHFYSSSLKPPPPPPSCDPFKVDLREYLRDFELWKLLSNAESS